MDRLQSVVQIVHISARRQQTETTSQIWKLVFDRYPKSCLGTWPSEQSKHHNLSKPLGIGFNELWRLPGYQCDGA